MDLIKDDILKNSITDTELKEMCNSIEFEHLLFEDFLGIPKYVKFMDFFAQY